MNTYILWFLVYFENEKNKDMKNDYLFKKWELLSMTA